LREEFLHVVFADSKRPLQAAFSAALATENFLGHGNFQRRGKRVGVLRGARHKSNHGLPPDRCKALIDPGLAAVYHEHVWRSAAPYRATDTRVQAVRERI
jgi:hypothetical protein